MDVSEDLVRQVRLLTRSRNGWKKRSATKQGQILYLRVKVRDLQASRDCWKQRALVAESSRLAMVPQPTACPPLQGVPSTPTLAHFEPAEQHQPTACPPLQGVLAVFPRENVLGE